MASSIKDNALLLLLAGSSLFQSVDSFAFLNKRAAAASAYCTNYNLTYKLTSITAPVQGTGSSTLKTYNISIDDKANYKQTVDGFGAAVTDATVTTFNSLSGTSLTNLLNSLITGSGANFSMMRHTIGASDLSSNAVYTYDDNGNNGSPDTNLQNFTLTSNGTAMAQLLAKMVAKQPALTVLGSPWSPPGWMKRNRVIMGNTDQYGVGGSETTYAPAWAQYFVKYINAFKNLGVTINAITLQNEPTNSKAGFPTMYMFPDEQGLLMQWYLGPALQNASLNTSMWGGEVNTDDSNYNQVMLQNAANYTNTVAWHCYAGNVSWSNMTDFQNRNPGINQYMTECYTPPTPKTATDNWFQPANFTIGPIQNWAKGVLAWTLGANANYGPHINSSDACGTCQGLVTINNDGTYTLNAAYYQMAQFSRWMPKGSYVLQTNGSSPTSYYAGLQAVSSLNPKGGNRTVVFMNTNTNDVFVRLNTTSGQTWNGKVPMSSVVTWVLPAAGT